MFFPLAVKGLIISFYFDTDDVIWYRHKCDSIYLSNLLVKGIDLKLWYISKCMTPWLIIHRVYKIFDWSAGDGFHCSSALCLFSLTFRSACQIVCFPICLITPLSVCLPRACLVCFSACMLVFCINYAHLFISSNIACLSASLWLSACLPACLLVCSSDWLPACCQPACLSLTSLSVGILTGSLLTFYYFCAFLHASLFDCMFVCLPLISYILLAYLHVSRLPISNKPACISLTYLNACLRCLLACLFA